MSKEVKLGGRGQEAGKVNSCLLISHFLFFIFYFTSSFPPGFQGLQRIIRQIPLAVPTIRPYRRIAWTQYSLHVGVKRQTGGKKGLIAFW